MTLSSLRSVLAENPGANRALKALFWIVIAAGVYQAVKNPYVTQWDFKLYMTCSKAQGLGLDPYDDILVRNTLGYHWRMPCLYPPLVIAAYRPFVWISPDALQYGSYASQILWTLLKLGMAAGLILLWRRFLDLKHEVHVLLFFLLAFGNPIYVDLRAGNIALLEQLLLWSGFAFLVLDYAAIFAVCVIVAAQPKLILAGFLALLLFVGRKPRWPGFLAACAGFAAVFALNHAFYPELTAAYLEKLVFTSDIWANEAGMINCSTRAFARDLLAAFGVKLSDLGRSLLMLGVDAAIVGVSGWACLRHARADEPRRRLEIVLFFCVTYALLAPRLKDYSFIVMLPPTLYILGKTRSARWRGAILACVCVNSLKGLGLRLGLSPEAALLLAYFKWYAVVLIWLRYVLRLAGARAPAFDLLKTPAVLRTPA